MKHECRVISKQEIEENRCSAYEYLDFEQTEELEITNHAYERAKERLKFNKNTLNKMAKRAFEKGLKHSDTKGKLNKYLTKLWFNYKVCNNVRIYGEVIYFFKGIRLITLYGVPQELKKNVKFCKKK